MSQDLATHWENRYQEQAMEEMPWFYSRLDPDVEHALDRWNIQQARVLDLGAGPGTQAIALARRGLKVTASDISGTAVMKADQRALEAGMDIPFVQDDILQTNLLPFFDVIIDRGCFHIFSAEQQTQYLQNVLRLMTPGGFLFLKCFSYLEPGSEGPNRFKPEQIVAVFENGFHIHTIEPTVFPGNRKPNPQALFCTFQKKIC